MPSERTAVERQGRQPQTSGHERTVSFGSTTFEVQRSRFEYVARVLAHVPKSVWAVLDAGVVCFGNYIGYQILYSQSPSTWVTSMTLTNVVFAISFVTAGVIVDLYDLETLRHRSRICVRSLLTALLAIAAAFVVMHTLLYEVFSRLIAFMAVMTFLLLSGSLRLLMCALLSHLKRRVLFVGCGDSVLRVCEAMGSSNAGACYQVLGYVASGTQDDPQDDRAETLPYLGDLADIQPICRANDIDEVVIGVEEKSNSELSHVVMNCLRLGCRVTNQPIFHERVLGEVPVDYINHEWFLLADLKGHGIEHLSVKRLFDFVFAVFGLIATLPLWPLIALAIKLEDGGQVFYSQNRVGRHNRLFQLTKFRTMRVDAEADGHAWSVPGDPRVTRVGRFLRHSHLDELPQLWTILLGDMSVVGPRPERPEFVEQLIQEIPYYDERHLVKPGLTGWAQINYRYGSSVEDAKQKLFLDLYYIKNMSFELDLIIIFRTMTTLFVSPS